LGLQSLVLTGLKESRASAELAAADKAKVLQSSPPSLSTERAITVADGQLLACWNVSEGLDTNEVINEQVIAIRWVASMV
jgi:hypothetical protein